MEAEGTTADVDSLPRGAFRCRLCHVTVANKPSLDDHLGGKKHQRLENLRSVRQSQELRSIFVSGFQKGTTALELSDYFESYGNVINVVMDKDKGVYAIVELQDEEMLQKVLAVPQHSLGGQKLRVKPREKKDFRYTPPKKQGSARREQLSPEKLAHNVCQVDDVDAQMSLMVQLFEFSESEQRLRDLLVKLFQEVFSEFFPESVILPFGSSVNGFSVSGCDLDLFLDLEKTKNFQASAKTIAKPPAAEEDAEMESRSEDSILSDIDLVTATVPEILDLVATVLQKCVPGVHHVQVVSTARRPVVKFGHKESGLRGDISINNKLALCNTRFLQFCTEADERVRPLVYAVRYWAKQQGLAGNLFGGGPLLNNYALTLLVFFFLQTRSPPVLPTVSRLKALSDDGELTVVDGWDCTFPKDPASLQPSGNTESCCSLLAEFFRVFENYNFAGGVVSLRKGRSLPLSDFLLSDAGEKFKVGPINLQDPFELSHNVAANVNEKTALRLQRSCQEAAKYCRSLQYQRKSSKGKSWGLVRLFQPGSPATPQHLVILLPLTPASQSHSQLYPSRDFPQLRYQRVCAGISYVLRHVLKCSCSENPPGPADDGESLGSDPEEEEDQLKAKTEQLSVGSKRSLDLEEAALGAPPAKKSRTEASLPDAERVTWDCVVWHRVWLGRRRVRRQFSSPEADPNATADPLELEGKVSEAISQQEGQARPADPLFGFTICARIRDGGPGEPDPQVSLNFTPDPEQGGAFQDFFHFLQGFLPRMVEQYLTTKPSDLHPPGDKSPPEGGI